MRDVQLLKVLFFKEEPGSLDKGAEPARVELERVLGGVRICSKAAGPWLWGRGLC